MRAKVERIYPQINDKCLKKIVKAGHKCLVYLDLDATEAEGKDAYRTATNKITDWSINNV